MELQVGIRPLVPLATYVPPQQVPRGDRFDQEQHSLLRIPQSAVATRPVARYGKLERVQNKLSWRPKKQIRGSGVRS